MIRVNVSVDAKDARAFIVTLQGEIKRPKSLNDALGRRLARELQGWFRARNKEPNKLGGTKTNFWKDVADATVMTEATDTGAVVSIAETRFRIHLYGGVIKPVKGQFLTVPIVKEAHGRRVAEYERATGRKLFRLGHTSLLMERTDSGTQSLVGDQVAFVRRRSGSRQINVRGGSRIRPVYVLKRSVTIKRDPRAMPAPEALAAALNDTAAKWVARQNFNASPAKTNLP